MKHVPLGPVPDFSRMPGWRTTGHAETERERDGRRIICIEVEAADEPAALHYCDHPKLRKNGPDPINFYDEPRGDMPVRITYRRRRWECVACGTKRIMEEPLGLAPGQRMTQRLFDHIVKMAQPNTFKEVSRRVGLDDTTVRNAFAKARKAYDAKPVRAPIVLGLDEKYLLGEARGIVCDIGKKRLINILDSRDKDLRPYVERMEDRHRTRVVVSDMFPGFQKLAREVFPDAKHIIDRFHVVQPANNAIEQMRLDLAKAEEKRYGLKRSRLRDLNGVLRTRWHSAKPEQREILLRMFDRWPDLYEAYNVKEDFANIYLIDTGPDEAERAFDTWQETIPKHLSEWFGWVMFANHVRPMVLNYFSEPYTTGFVEGINAIIGDRWRAGRGYSMDVLRFKFVDRPLDFSVLRNAEIRLVLLISFTIRQSAVSTKMTSGHQDPTPKLAA